MKWLMRAALIVTVAMGCSGDPPANWEKGGAMLDLPRVRWALGDMTVDVMEDGRVMVNGIHELGIDAGGRVFDYENEPVALLEPDGRLIGRDDELIGIIGSEHAALPDHDSAWLSLMPTGEVIRYDEDGERYAFGIWDGCKVTPHASQMCMLITHLVAKQILSRPRGSGVSVGVGVGVGVPIR